MANLAFLREVSNVTAYKFIYVQGTATLDDGNIVVATTLSTDTFEDDVYAVTQPALSTDGNLAIVVGEEFYQDASGNRINITDPTDITYPAGAIIRAVRPEIDMTFKISNAAITGTAVLGEYLIPADTSYEWVPSATIPANNKLALRVERAAKNISFKGNTPIVGVEARVVNYVAEATA